MPPEHLRRCSIDDTKEVEMIGGFRAGSCASQARSGHVTSCFFSQSPLSSARSPAPARELLSPTRRPTRRRRPSFASAPILLRARSACFALRRTTGVVATIAAGSESGRGGERLAAAGRPRRCLQAADETRLGADWSRSSTRRTTRTPRATSRPTGASSACRHARRPTAASARSTRTAGRARCPRRTRAGRGRSCSTSRWSRRRARSARSSSSKRPARPIANLGTAVNQAVAQGAIAISNSYGGSESSGDPTISTTYYQHPGIAITVSSGDSRVRRRVPGELAVGHLGRRDGAPASDERARLDGDDVVHQCHRRCRQRLLGVRDEAVVPDRHRLHAPDGCRRVRSRRSGDRRGRLRQLRIGRLDGVRRHERGVADHRRRSTRLRRRRPQASSRISTRTRIRAPCST